MRPPLRGRAKVRRGREVIKCARGVGEEEGKK